MTKILHVISDSNIGGAGRYLLTYLKNCNTGTFNVSVALPSGSKLIPEIKKLGFSIHEIDGMAEKSFSLSATIKLCSLFRRQKPNIVHSHASLSARIAARLSFVKKTIYTRHSVFPQKKYLTKGIGKLLNGIIGELLADGVIAVAEAAKVNLTDTGINPKKIKVIYNGVDPVRKVTENEKRAFRDKYELGDNRIVAIIARLDTVKGHEYFIDAAEVVSDSIDDIKFVIVGGGERENALREYVRRKKLDKTVIFTGFISDTSAIEHIMDIQINSSFGTEAASLSLLEGMSLGKPAVVSDFGGNPEIIKNGINGYVVPAKNAQAAADKILLLLKDDKIKEEISKQAINIFNQKFTSKIMTEKMENFYNEVLKFE